MYIIFKITPACIQTYGGVGVGVTSGDPGVVGVLIGSRGIFFLLEKFILEGAGTKISQNKQAATKSTT